MKPTSLALTFAVLALSSLAVGCGSKSSGGDTSAAAAPSGAPAAAKGGIVATCVRKASCTEYRNSADELTESLCTGLEGKWNKSSTPCATEKLVGTCTPKSSPDSSTLYYGGPEDQEIDKGLCEALEGTWKAGPTAKAAASSAPAASGAPAAAAPAGAAPAKHEPAKAPAKPAPKKGKK
jgi:hypothetical protein